MPEWCDSKFDGVLTLCHTIHCHQLVGLTSLKKPVQYLNNIMMGLTAFCRYIHVSDGAIEKGNFFNSLLNKNIRAMEELMAYLRHLYNGNTVSIYELGDTTLIGRHLDCNIHIDEPTVSSKHAEVVNTEEGWLLKDLGSTNGVIVRGKLVERQILESGLVFSLGTHSFEFLESLPTDLDRTMKIKKSWIPGIYYTE